MIVITNAPIIRVDSIPEVSSGIDGTDTESVRTFQVWASMNHQAQLAADGIFGPKTSAAYDKWGKEWEADQPKGAPVVAAPPKVSTGVTYKPPTRMFPEKQDKPKALTTEAKIAVGVGILLLSFVIYKTL